MHLKRALRVKKAQLTYCDISNEDVQGPNILPNYQIIYIYIYTQTSTMMAIPYHQGRRNVS